MYVVQVRPMSEFKVKHYLNDVGIKALVPTQIISERRGGEWIGKMKRLFSGYVFIDLDQITSADYYKILSCDWTLRFLGAKGKPEKLQPKEIDLIRFLNSNDFKNKLATMTLESGQTYSLAGVEMQAVDINKRQRRGKFEVELAGEKHIITLSCNFKSKEQTNESEEQGLIRPFGGSDLS